MDTVMSLYSLAPLLVDIGMNVLMEEGNDADVDETPGQRGD